jgi:hypothetical protein
MSNIEQGMSKDEGKKRMVNVASYFSVQHSLFDIRHSRFR